MKNNKRNIKLLFRVLSLGLVLGFLSGCGAYMVSGGSNTTHYGHDRDHKIKREIIQKLVNDPKIRAKTIRVKVNRGHVILSGTVHHRWMKRRVKLLAKSVKGVHEVSVRLEYQH